MRLEDKVAVVTGGGAGIGRAIAQRFVAEGAVVVIADRDEAAAAATAEALEAAGGRASHQAVDVSQRDQVQALMKTVVERHGRIDVLVNNAGITRYRPFLEATGEDWDKVLDVDLKGVFFCAQAVAPYMVSREAGRIVNISSVAGTGTTPFNTAGSPGGSAAYASAKAAVILLTKTLARELGPHGITVNCVAPGTFLTAITTSTRTPEQAAAHSEHRRKACVLGRIGKVEELAASVLFFASDDASYVTGQTLSVDGGRSDRM